MPISLRPDFDAPRLRFLTRESTDAGKVRRLLALAAIYDGGRRMQAPEIGCVTLQVIRNWLSASEKSRAGRCADRSAACWGISPPRNVRKPPWGNLVDCRRACGPIAAASCPPRIDHTP